MKFKRPFLCGFVPVVSSLIAWQSVVHTQDSKRVKADVPRTWDDLSLQEWATPVAGLNVRPTHIAPEAYYSLPVENLRTYPVYVPDREPPGYWDMLQRM